MSREATDRERLLRDGAAQILARAAEPRSLSPAVLLPRITATLEKYLLRDRPRASSPEIKEFLDALRADDLCLVVACERGDEAAWSDLMERYRATVLSAARSTSATESEAEELAQSVWAELYGLRRERAGSGGKLAYYSGCGSLGGWLRAVVGQLSVDRHRKSSRLVQTEEAADFDRMARESHGDEDGFRPAPAPNPEHALALKETTHALRTALQRAIGALPAEDRLLIKLYYFDGLRLREAGAVLGVHEATASRRLSRLHGEVRERVTKILVSEYGWTPQETTRAFAESAVTHLNADLGQALTAKEPASAEGPP